MPTHQVVITLGSNHRQRYDRLQQAVKQLQQYLQITAVTPPLLTSPFGCSSPDFLNQMILGTTDDDYPQLLAKTKLTEQMLGRHQYIDTPTLIDIDIDIMLFDGKRYHEKDWERDYIQKLYQDLMQQQ